MRNKLVVVDSFDRNAANLARLMGHRLITPQRAVGILNRLQRRWAKPVSHELAIAFQKIHKRYLDAIDEAKLNRGELHYRTLHGENYYYYKQYVLTDLLDKKGKIGFAAALSQNNIDFSRALSGIPLSILTAVIIAFKFSHEPVKLPLSKPA